MLAGAFMGLNIGIVGATGVVRRRQRLGGMLNYYYRDAA